MEKNIFELIKTSNLNQIKKVFNPEYRKNKDDNGVYLTFYAALRGKLDIFEYLLSQNVPVKGSDNSKNTILFYAIKGNNLDIIKLIIEKNINIEQLNKIGASAVCYVDKSTDPKIIEYLIKNGLDINKKYKIIQKKEKKYYIERNLLFYAIKQQNFKIIELLTTKKVNFSTSLFNENENTKTKMFYYILYYGNLKIVKYFIDANIKTKLPKDDIKKIINKYIDNDDVLLLKFILNDLEYDSNELKFGPNNRYDILTYSIINKRLKIVKLLLDKGIENNYIDEYYYKPINYSVKYSEIEILKLLENTDLNYIIYPEETLLEMASQNNDKEIIKYLLYNDNLDFNFEFKYDVELDFDDEISCVCDVKNLLNPLITNNLGISFIKRAVKQGVKIHNSHILLAIENTRLDILKFLIKAGTNIDLLKENEIKTETIISFLIKQVDNNNLVDVLTLAVKQNYLIYYVLKYEYKEIFKSLNLNSKDVIPKFNIKNKLLIPSDSEQKEIKNNMILDFGTRIFNIYYDKDLDRTIYIDNYGIEYKNLPKTAKKDDSLKSEKAISFFNKYKGFL
jgi:ankyrin repeat protein